MNMNTNELTRAALDWAVAKAAGHLPPGYSFDPVRHRYSTDWAQGGPIIEREGITVTRTTLMGAAGAYAWAGYLPINEDERCEEHGPTPLIAAMRCYVASRLGEEVEIPEELK
jgi:hypothetical protein